MSTNNRNKVCLILNDEAKTEISAPWDLLIQRSQLFSQIYQGCDYYEKISLDLERPEKFFDLLNYIMYGKIPEALELQCTFLSFINDAVYLQILDLEEVLLDKLQEMSMYGFVSLPNLQHQSPSRDFIDRFLRERYSQVAKYQENLLFFLFEWITEAQIDQETTKSLSNLPLEMSDISVGMLQAFKSNYPESFDYVVSAKSTFATLMSKIKYKNCLRTITKAALGDETCYSYDQRSARHVWSTHNTK